jgi:hypothetical protein
MKPTAGDIRCMAFGHLTRMAIWRLKPTWNPGLTTLEKFAVLRKTMNGIATADSVLKRLEKIKVPAAAESGSLFDQDETRIFADAVSF